MDISVLSNQPSGRESRPILPETLFQRLSQLGSIQASVASISKGQAVLSTQLGQILTANALDLKVGDRLIIQSNNNSQQPTLKISQISKQATVLNSTANQSLARMLLPARSTTAVVTAHHKTDTIVKMGNQQFKIQSQPDFKIGQLLYLTKNIQGNNIEVRPRDHVQILKSAIARLIPQQTNSKNPSALVQLARMIEDFTLQNNRSGSALDKLIQAFPELNKFTRATIRQWISYIVNPSKSDGDQAQNPQSPYQLIQSLTKSESALLFQIKQMTARANNGANSAADQANMAEDIFQSMVRDLIKLGEQSLSQQLFQQSGVRLQQEQQQPLLLHLSIPLYDQEKLTTLGLKIRQRKPESDPQNQIWDIHLDFEFGLLGHISTHLTISSETVSAIFWSQKIETQQKIKARLDDFQMQITQAGLLPGQFQSFHGKPPHQDSAATTEIPEALLDIRV
ncbi:MAG: hypothetical protein HKN34_00360 [Gammaproteobacteria bacterium]|nr:hypothetical protein [Gammaproteobacteria bacterium]